MVSIRFVLSNFSKHFANYIKQEYIVILLLLFISSYTSI